MCSLQFLENGPVWLGESLDPVTTRIIGNLQGEGNDLTLAMLAWQWFTVLGTYSYWVTEDLPYPAAGCLVFFNEDVTSRQCGRIRIPAVSGIYVYIYNYIYIQLYIIIIYIYPSRLCVPTKRNMILPDATSSLREKNQQFTQKLILQGGHMFE